MSKNEAEKRIIEMDEGYYFCESCKTWHALYHDRYHGTSHKHLGMLDESETNSSDPKYYYCRECQKWHSRDRAHLNLLCYVKKGTTKRLKIIIL